MKNYSSFNSLHNVRKTQLYSQDIRVYALTNYLRLPGVELSYYHRIAIAA